MSRFPYVHTRCVYCSTRMRSRRAVPVCKACEPRPDTASANRTRPMVSCGGCGKRIRSQSTEPRCAECRPPQHAVFAATQANRTPTYCDLCGRVHAGHWECIERSERSGEEVRLWLLERGEL